MLGGTREISPLLESTICVDAPDAAPKEGLRVKLRSVSKSFGGLTVLDGLDLDIESGSFVAIAGRSGEGKSTLLRLLAGLARADAGTILLDGSPVEERARDVTMMFQDARLLPWQRVLANVGIARGPRWRERAVTALAEVRLANRVRDWPATLSGGQRQRVALARALLDWPGLLLLDEPFGALDALTRSEMHSLVLRLWHEVGFTAVIVTHDVAEALFLADRVLVLQHGRIARDVRVPATRPRTAGANAALHAEILSTLVSGHRGFAE